MDSKAHHGLSVDMSTTTVVVFFKIVSLCQMNYSLLVSLVRSTGSKNPNSGKNAAAIHGISTMYNVPITDDLFWCSVRKSAGGPNISILKNVNHLILHYLTYNVA